MPNKKSKKLPVIHQDPEPLNEIKRSTIVEPEKTPEQDSVESTEEKETPELPTPEPPKPVEKVQTGIRNGKPVYK